MSLTCLGSGRRNSCRDKSEDPFYRVIFAPAGLWAAFINTFFIVLLSGGALFVKFYVIPAAFRFGYFLCL